MNRCLIVLLVGGLAWSTVSQPANAIVAFKKEFEKMYLTDKSSEDFKKTVKSNKTGCFVCHQGKKRKNNNPYGAELAKLLDKKKHARDKEAIAAALKKVEPIRSKKDDKKSPTYGELIKDNKLPGGPLEEVKKEPKKEGDKGDGDKGKEDKGDSDKKSDEGDKDDDGKDKADEEDDKETDKGE